MSKSSNDLGLKVLWEKIWIPEGDTGDQSLAQDWKDETYQDEIPDVRTIALKNNEIEIPDPKAIRSMSRASIFLSSQAASMKTHLDSFLNRSPFSVGIYCAVENGPIDGPSTAEILNRSTDEYNLVFAEAYRKLRNPKMYLKQLPNLAPAQLGISLGIQGPMNVYTHSRFACPQALEQAEFDLITEKVDAALVLSAHAFDDFWIMKRSRREDPRTLCEGAAYQILVRGTSFKKEEALRHFNKRKDREYYTDKQNYFGISDPLINLIRKGN